VSNLRHYLPLLPSFLVTNILIPLVLIQNIPLLHKLTQPLINLQTLHYLIRKVSKLVLEQSV
jgi:hypothetical protein